MNEIQQAKDNFAKGLTKAIPGSIEANPKLANGIIEWMNSAIDTNLSIEEIADAIADGVRIWTKETLYTNLTK
jgi:transcriptional regulator GlxA family with amidase domain